MAKDSTPEKVVQEIRWKTHRRFSAEEKIRIVLEGLRGEESIATLRSTTCGGSARPRTKRRHPPERQLA